MTRFDPAPMRIALAGILLALAIAVPGAHAVEATHLVYLHEDPLHVLPETINARVGDVLTFTVENPATEGKTPHNLRVCGDGSKLSEACDDVWAFTGMIQPGQSAPLTFTAKKAGSFDYYCYIPGHKGGGMSGVLVVQGDAEEKKGLPLGAPLAILALAALALAWRRRA